MAGIYIHIPFCKQACYYCDFHFSTSLKNKNKLIQALLAELILRKDEFSKVLVETIYFGGGTPSLLSAEELESIINTITQHYACAEQMEVTLEANPDDIVLKSLEDSKKRLSAYKTIGVNRLSIGIQSFVEKHLTEMNRAHSAKEAERCLDLATTFFNNISIDLIYGIPTMNDTEWETNLSTAFAYKIPHISSYALTVEPKTALEKFIKLGKYPKVTEAHAHAQFQILVNKTKADGFVHYETSNFGKPDFFSKHNSGYWQGKPYIGIGPSAHSFNGKQRSWNVSNNIKYTQSILEGKLPNTTEILSKNDRFNEYVMTGLRTVWGVSIPKIESDFGPGFKTYLLNTSERFLNQDLLTITNNDTLKTTEKGKFLADGIASELFMI